MIGYNDRELRAVPGDGVKNPDGSRIPVRKVLLWTTSLAAIFLVMFVVLNALVLTFATVHVRDIKIGPFSSENIPFHFGVSVKHPSLLDYNFRRCEIFLSNPCKNSSVLNACIDNCVLYGRNNENLLDVGGLISLEDVDFFQNIINRHGGDDGSVLHVKFHIEVHVLYIPISYTMSKEIDLKDHGKDSVQYMDGLNRMFSRCSPILVVDRIKFYGDEQDKIKMAVNLSLPRDTIMHLVDMPVLEFDLSFVGKNGKMLKFAGVELLVDSPNVTVGCHLFSLVVCLSSDHIESLLSMIKNDAEHLEVNIKYVDNVKLKGYFLNRFLSRIFDINVCVPRNQHIDVYELLYKEFMSTNDPVVSIRPSVFVDRNDLECKTRLERNKFDLDTEVGFEVRLERKLFSFLNSYLLIDQCRLEGSLHPIFFNNRVDRFISKSFRKALKDVGLVVRVEFLDEDNYDPYAFKIRLSMAFNQKMLFTFVDRFLNCRLRIFSSRNLMTDAEWNAFYDRDVSLVISGSNENFMSRLMGLLQIRLLLSDISHVMVSFADTKLYDSLTSHNEDSTSEAGESYEDWISLIGMRVERSGYNMRLVTRSDEHSTSIDLNVSTKSDISNFKRYVRFEWNSTLFDIFYKSSELMRLSKSDDAELFINLVHIDIKSGDLFLTENGLVIGEDHVNVRMSVRSSVNPEAKGVLVKKWINSNMFLLLNTNHKLVLDENIMKFHMHLYESMVLSTNELHKFVIMSSTNGSKLFTSVSIPTKMMVDCNPSYMQDTLIRLCSLSVSNVHGSMMELLCQLEVFKDVLVKAIPSHLNLNFELFLPSIRLYLANMSGRQNEKPDHLCQLIMPPLHISTSIVHSRVNIDVESGYSIGTEGGTVNDIVKDSVKLVMIDFHILNIMAGKFTNIATYIPKRVMDCSNYNFSDNLKNESLSVEKIVQYPLSGISIIVNGILSLLLKHGVDIYSGVDEEIGPLLCESELLVDMEVSSRDLHKMKAKLDITLPNESVLAMKRNKIQMNKNNLGIQIYPLKVSWVPLKAEILMVKSDLSLNDPIIKIEVSEGKYLLSPGFEDLFESNYISKKVSIVVSLDLFGFSRDSCDASYFEDSSSLFKHFVRCMRDHAYHSAVQKVLNDVVFSLQTEECLNSRYHEYGFRYAYTQYLNGINGGNSIFCAKDVGHTSEVKSLEFSNEASPCFIHLKCSDLIDFFAILFPNDKRDPKKPKTKSNLRLQDDMIKIRFSDNPVHPGTPERIKFPCLVPGMCKRIPTSKEVPPPLLRLDVDVDFLIRYILEDIVKGAIHALYRLIYLYKYPRSCVLNFKMNDAIKLDADLYGVGFFGISVFPYQLERRVILYEKDARDSKDVPDEGGFHRNTVKVLVQLKDDYEAMSQLFQHLLIPANFPRGEIRYRNPVPTLDYDHVGKNGKFKPTPMQMSIKINSDGVEEANFLSLLLSVLVPEISDFRSVFGEEKILGVEEFDIEKSYAHKVHITMPLHVNHGVMGVKFYLNTPTDPGFRLDVTHGKSKIVYVTLRDKEFTYRKTNTFIDVYMDISDPQVKEDALSFMIKHFFVRAAELNVVVGFGDAIELDLDIELAEAFTQPDFVQLHRPMGNLLKSEFLGATYKFSSKFDFIMKYYLFDLVMDVRLSYLDHLSHIKNRTMSMRSKVIKYLKGNKCKRSVNCYKLPANENSTFAKLMPAKKSGSYDQLVYLGFEAERKSTYSAMLYAGIYESGLCLQVGGKSVVGLQKKESDRPFIVDVGFSLPYDTNPEFDSCGIQFQCIPRCDIRGDNIVFQKHEYYLVSRNSVSLTQYFRIGFDLTFRDPKNFDLNFGLIHSVRKVTGIEFDDRQIFTFQFSSLDVIFSSLQSNFGFLVKGYKESTSPKRLKVTPYQFVESAKGLPFRLEMAYSPYAKRVYVSVTHPVSKVRFDNFISIDLKKLFKNSSPYICCRSYANDHFIKNMSVSYGVPDLKKSRLLTEDFGPASVDEDRTYFLEARDSCDKPFYGAGANFDWNFVMIHENNRSNNLLLFNAEVLDTKTKNDGPGSFIHNGIVPFRFKASVFGRFQIKAYVSSKSIGIDNHSYTYWSDSKIVGSIYIKPL